MIKKRKKNKSFYKKLKIKLDIKKWNHRLKRKRNKRKICKKSKNNRQCLNNISYQSYKVVAPYDFSFINNVDETVSFFATIDEIIKKNKKCKIFIDLSKVEKITVDVVMYLTAKMKKLQYKKMTNKAFYGNVPKNKNAREILSESGFFDFVNSKTKTHITKEKISISTGDKFDREQSKKMCDFVINNSEYKKENIYFVYEMLSEMMSNTSEHAYNDIKDDLNMWYLYSERTHEGFEFIFLDTGVGIPTSVNKRLLEKIILNDSKLLLSALNGEYRSSTKLKSRGRGLQYIKKCAVEQKISILFIISNKGIVKFENGKLIDFYNTEGYPLEGTLYYWKIV